MRKTDQRSVPTSNRGVLLIKKARRSVLGLGLLLGCKITFRFSLTHVSKARFSAFFFGLCYSPGSRSLGTFAIGMLLAVMLECKELHFRYAYRPLLILPYAVPSVLSILIFKGLYNQEFGAVNEFVRALHLFTPEWETNPWGARAMVLLVNLCLGDPYMMLSCTVRLQPIPSASYDASALEGSNPIISFFMPTLPF